MVADMDSTLHLSFPLSLLSLSVDSSSLSLCSLLSVVSNCNSAAMAGVRGTLKIDQFRVQWCILLLGPYFPLFPLLFSPSPIYSSPFFSIFMISFSRFLDNEECSNLMDDRLYKQRSDGLSLVQAQFSSLHRMNSHYVAIYELLNEDRESGKEIDR